jgi:hypothetical protein
MEADSEAPRKIGGLWIFWYPNSENTGWRTPQRRVHAQRMDRGPAVLRTIAPSSQEFKCISLPYNVASTVEGELIYVGHGTPDEYEALGDAIRGRL